ncbi:MAG: radical SAM protein [Terracidiphilus sp.]|jgi:radical SAM protein with 4Fe4S-binding SPASM domain
MTMQPMHNIPARGGIDFDESPFLAIWEVTQSCDLACKHCRAAAQPIPHPDELTHEEGKALIDQIAEMHIPIFVFTGGDPLKRKDVFELIRYAAGKGVHVAVTPSATPLLTREQIFKMKEAGVVRLGISLDGSSPEIHDAFRGLPGAWARTIQAIEWAGEAGIPIQVHTTISRHNANDLDNLCNLFEKLAIVMWNVFFLVPVGRGQLDDLLSGEEFEQVFGKIYELSRRANFQIKTTEAMHYRRYLLQHNLEEKRAAHANSSGHGHPGTAVLDIGNHPSPEHKVSGHDFSRAEQTANKNEGALAPAYEPGTPTAEAKTRNMSWATRRVNDGKGFVFISHMGNVYPSGFLPIHAGNIRETPLADIYRNAPIFKALRDTKRLEGKCGACEYKEICGGSRARAYALTGDPLAAEPCCIYQPKNWDPEREQTAETFKQWSPVEPMVTL